MVDICWPHFHCSLPRGNTLQYLADCKQLSDARGRQRRHARAQTGRPSQKLALLQPAQGFAERSATDTKTHCQSDFLDLGSGGKLAIDDRLAQLLENPMRSGRIWLLQAVGPQPMQ